MSTLADALRKLIDTPDDLTELPSIIEKVSLMEEAELGYLESIGRLKELNKQYLGQIPIAGVEPEPEPERLDTIEDARNYIIESLGGN